MRATSIILAVTLTVLTACGTRDTFTVSAAASLRESVEAIGEVFQADHPEITLLFNFGASGSLRHQIEQGAPVDVFISAAPVHIQMLKEAGLLATAATREILTNDLVLVTPKNNQRIQTLGNLRRGEIQRVAIGAPLSVPSGMYARQALQSLGLWEKLQGRLVLAKNTLQVLAYVESGEVDAGFIYATDAARSRKVHVVAKVPSDSHAPIVYAAAITADAAHPIIARSFVHYLSDPSARAIFQAHGFKTVAH